MLVPVRLMGSVALVVVACVPWAAALSLAPCHSGAARCATPRATRQHIRQSVKRSPRLGAADEQPSALVKGAWYGTELFGKLAALARPGAGSSAADPSMPAGAPRSMAEAVSRIEADYERRYFILGRMDEALYDPDCEFADPFVSFRGRERFVSNLANLAGGFITDSRVRTLSAQMEESSEAGPARYTTRLLVQLQLALPWRPVLAWVWGVSHVVDPRSLLVVRHLEAWEVGAAEGVRQLLTPGPPDGLLQGKTGSTRAQASKQPAPQQLDPVLGPLVRLSRAVGITKPEEDGWEGEPSAWAQPTSFAQKASEWSATYLRSFKQLVADIAAGSFDPQPVDERIAAETQAGGVFLYSFSSCPFCRRAKQLLDDERAVYTVVELDQLPDGPQIRARVGRLTGRTSMPAIWVGGAYVGGCNDGPDRETAPGLSALQESGELRSRLQAAGALRRGPREWIFGQ